MAPTANGGDVYVGNGEFMGTATGGAFPTDASCNKKDLQQQPQQRTKQNCALTEKRRVQIRWFGVAVLMFLIVTFTSQSCDNVLHRAAELSQVLQRAAELSQASQRAA